MVTTVLVGIVLADGALVATALLGAKLRTSVFVGLSVFVGFVLVNILT